MVLGKNFDFDERSKESQIGCQRAACCSGVAGCRPWFYNEKPPRDRFDFRTCHKGVQGTIFFSKDIFRAITSAVRTVRHPTT